MVNNLTLGKVIDLINEEAKVNTENEYDVIVHKDGRELGNVIFSDGKTMTVDEGCMGMFIERVTYEYDSDFMLFIAHVYLK